MVQTTLRAFLEEHRDSQFIVRGKVVSSRHLANQYNVYLDAQISTEGCWVFFASADQEEQVPFACRVPVQLRPAYQEAADTHVPASCS